MEGMFIIYDQASEVVFEKEVSWANWYQTCDHINQSDIENLAKAYRKALGRYI